jgi:hypothetical protein
MAKNRGPLGANARINLQAVGLAAAILLVCTGPAIADTVEEHLQEVLHKIEALVTKLALDDSLDAQETDTLRSDLADVYRELAELKDQVAPPPAPAESESPATETPTAAEATATEGQPATEPDAATATMPAPEAAPGAAAAAPVASAPAAGPEWRMFAKAKAVISPPEAAFSGWQDTADIDFRWGEYGQIILVVANDGYSAQWTIDDAYHGNVNVSTQSQPTGDIIVQIDDDMGQHQFMLNNGGLGPLLYRQTRVAAPPADAPQPPVLASAPQPAPAPAPSPALAGVWYRTYREQIASGNLAGSEALEWFISQYDSGPYDSPELERLGNSLRGLSGDARDSLGTVNYAVEGQARNVAIPDPRINPVSFIQLMNKIYGMQMAGQEYSIDLN